MPGYNVIVFEDIAEDRDRLVAGLAAEGCVVRALGTAALESIPPLVAEAPPDFAVVDCFFEYKTDGVKIIKALQEARPDLPVVVCSRLLDRDQDQSFIASKYRNLQGVRALVGKQPFPTGRELIRLANVEEDQ